MGSGGSASETPRENKMGINLSEIKHDKNIFNLLTGMGACITMIAGYSLGNALNQDAPEAFHVIASGISTAMGMFATRTVICARNKVKQAYNLAKNHLLNQTYKIAQRGNASEFKIIDIDTPFERLAEDNVILNNKGMPYPYDKTSNESISEFYSSEKN